MFCFWVQFKDKTRQKQWQRVLKQRQKQAEEDRAGKQQQRRKEQAAKEAEKKLPAFKRRKVDQRQDDKDFAAEYALLQKLKKKKISEVETLQL